MTFLTPMHAALAAGVAVPALLILYFLKLRRRALRVSSTLLWERAVRDVQVNVPLRWIRFDWLLVLQLAGLACLLLAFARPAINMPRGGSRRAVILVDRSASMSAMDGAGAGTGGRVSRLEEAKRRAGELARSLARGPGGARMMVVQFAATSAALTPMVTDASSAEEAIATIAPTDQPGDLAGALKTVAALVADRAADQGHAEPPVVYLFSDGSFDPNLPAPAAAGVEMRFTRVGPGAEAMAAGVRNRGIVALSARRDEEDPATVRVFLRVENAEASPATAIVDIAIDEQSAPALALNLPAAALENGQWRGGEATATVALSNTAGGVLRASLTGSDMLAADNAAWLVLPPAAKPRVLLVGPGANGEEADAFLTSTLLATQPKSLETIGAARLAELSSGQAGGDWARGYDLIVFDRVAEKGAAPPVPTLAFGAGAGPAIAGVHMRAAGGGSGGASGTVDSTRFITWARTHPVMRAVNLDSIFISPPGVITIDAGAKGVESLAEGVGGPLIVAARDGPVRRIATGFDLARSNWGPDVSFPIFVTNAIDYLTLRADALAGRAVTTTQPASVRPAAGAKRLTLSGAGGFSAVVDVPATLDVARGESASLGVIERAGLYRVAGAEAADATLAVNMVDAHESLLRTAETVSVAGAKVAAGGAGDATPREVWPACVAAAAALLTLEWFVYAWRMRA